MQDKRIGNVYAPQLENAQVTEATSERIRGRERITLFYDGLHTIPGIQQAYDSMKPVLDSDAGISFGVRGGIAAVSMPMKTYNALQESLGSDEQKINKPESTPAKPADSRFYKDKHSHWHDRENGNHRVSAAEVRKEAAAGHGKADMAAHTEPKNTKAGGQTISPVRKRPAVLGM